MAIQQVDIDIFLNKAQQKIASIGNEARDLDDEGFCIDDKITCLLQLSSAVELLQDDDADLTDDEKWEIISIWNKKADLTTLPIGIFDQSCLVDNVLVAAGYLTGPQGPQGPQGVPGATGPAGADGADGTNGANGNNGWSAIPALVDYNGGKIIQIAGWTGGTGTAPTAGVYIGSSGFVSNPAQAINIQGPQGAQGAQGIQGATGTSGQSSYTYIAYASDNTGTGFTLVFDSSLDYIAIKSTATPIASPSSSDFSGLWKNYKGAKGDRFIIDVQGSISDRTLYDSEDTGFSFLDTDNGVIYIKLSPLSGDWGGPYAFQGYKGWSPLFANVIDGERVVQQIVDWTGGEGTKPSTIDQYIGPIGIVNNVTDGQDIRGLIGERFFPDASGLASARTAHDAELKDYIYYATDTGQVSIKNSNTSGDWSSWYDWRGAQGPAGPVGTAGTGLTSDCVVATTANLSATYNGTSKTLTASANGAIGSIDGVSLSLNDRILVKNQSTGSQNGIYTVTDLGSVSTPYVLTRGADFDTTYEVQKFGYVIVKLGTTNAATRWTLSNSRPSIVLDTTALNFVSQNVTYFLPIDGSIAMTGDLSVKNILMSPTSKVVNSSNSNNYLQISTAGVVLNSDGEVTVQATALNVTTGSYKASLKSDLLTGNVVHQLPVSSGTIALLSDIETYFVGKYTSLAALQAAVPTGADGDYGIVDSGAGSDAKQYIWDSSDSAWVLGSGSGGVTSIFGRNGVVTAQAGDYSTSLVTEGSNLYFTNARVDSRVQVYTGDVTLSGTAFSIGANKVTNSMLAGSIAYSKMDSTTSASFVSFAISGTAGSGYGEFIAQSSTPSAPSSTGFRLSAGSTGNFGWIKNDGGTDIFRRSFSGTLTANRVFTWQDLSYTVAGTDISNTFTASQKFGSGLALQDSNGNNLIAFPSTVTSAVNYIQISNAATTGFPSFTASGTDTNISISVIGKGTGGLIVPDGTAANPGLRFNGSQTTGLFTGGNTIGLSCNGVVRVTVSVNSVNLTDSTNFQFATTNGTKIGSGTNQKLAFWNKTPIVQPTSAITGATITANSGTAVNDASTFGGYTIGQVIQALINVGILA